MGNREEPQYKSFKGKCQKCGQSFTYHNSVKLYTEICRECEEVEMARFTGLKGLWEAALGPYLEQGFSLKEVDDHFLELYFKDKKICIFNQAAVTILTLHKACQDFLEEMNVGIK